MSNLLKKLSYVGTIGSFGYNTTLSVKEIISEKEYVSVSTEWIDYSKNKYNIEEDEYGYKGMYYIDVNKSDTFCNYRDGNELLIQRTKGSDTFAITFKYYHCSSYDGFPEKVEYKIMLEVTPDVICKYFKHLAEQEFGTYVEQEFIKEEKLRIKRAKNVLLKNF